MQKWEYHTTPVTYDLGIPVIDSYTTYAPGDTDYQEKLALNDFLNRMGGEGWELTGTVIDTNSGSIGDITRTEYLIFKKPGD